MGTPQGLHKGSMDSLGRVLMDSMRTPWGLHRDSTRAPQGLHGLHGDSMGTPQGLYRDSMRTPRGLHGDSTRTLWERVGDCKIQKIM